MKEDGGQRRVGCPAAGDEVARIWGLISEAVPVSHANNDNTGDAQGKARPGQGRMMDAPPLHDICGGQGNCAG